MAYLDAILAFLAANTMVYFFAAFAALMLGEGWLARRRGLAGAYDGVDTRVNLGSGIGSFVIGAASKTAVAGALYSVYELTPLRLPADHWATWVVAVVVLDFCLYWAHRFSHETRIGWAMHVTHHSSRRYNLSVAVRQSWTTTLLAGFFVPLPLLGVPLEVLLLVKVLSSVYQFWLHTEVIGRLPRWFEFVFNTPSHHRVHHGSNPRYLDKNYGGTFILWDRAFGSFAAEVERPVYGLTTPRVGDGVWHVNFHEWQALLGAVRGAGSWREALAYCVRRPGWRPEPRCVARVRRPRGAGETGVAWLAGCGSTLVGAMVAEECGTSRSAIVVPGG